MFTFVIRHRKLAGSFMSLHSNPCGSKVLKSVSQQHILNFKKVFKKKIPKIWQAIDEIRTEEKHRYVRLRTEVRREDGAAERHIVFSLTFTER